MKHQHFLPLHQSTAPARSPRSLTALLSVCVMRNGTAFAHTCECVYVCLYIGGRLSWGSAEGIGLGSRCVCLMSSCKKWKTDREKDFLPWTLCLSPSYCTHLLHEDTTGSDLALMTLLLLIITQNYNFSVSWWKYNNDICRHGIWLHTQKQTLNVIMV